MVCTEFVNRDEAIFRFDLLFRCIELYYHMKGEHMGHLNVYIEPFRIVNGTNVEIPQQVWSHSGERDEDWSYMQKEVIRAKRLDAFVPMCKMCVCVCASVCVCVLSVFVCLVGVSVRLVFVCLVCD